MKYLLFAAFLSFGTASVADTAVELAEGQSLVVCNDSLVGTIERAVQDLNYRLMRNPITVDYPAVVIRQPFKVSAPTIFSDSQSGTRVCVTISK